MERIAAGPAQVLPSANEAWIWVLASGLTVTGLYLALGWAPLGQVAYVWVGLSAVIALLAGPRQHGVTYTTPWTLIAVAVALLGAGRVASPTVAAPWPASALADALTAPGYALLVVSSIVLARHHWRGQRAQYAALDGAMVLIGMASLTLAVFAIPATQHSTRPHALAVLTSCYPLLDVVVVLGQVAMWFTTASALRAYRLMAVGVIGLLLGDVGYAWAASHGDIVTPRVVDCLYLVALSAVAAGAAHPSLRAYNDVRLLQAHPWDRTRLVLLGTAVCLPALAELLAHGGHTPQRAVLAAGCAAVSLALLWRAIAAVNAQAQITQDLVYRSTHDPLTGLRNREGFDAVVSAELAARRPPQQSVSVLYIDLDGFKYVNDAYGHSVGDELIKSAAEILARTAGDANPVCRLGGDEFAVVVRDDGEGSAGELLAAAIVSAFVAPVDLSTGARFHTGASVGMANSLQQRPPSATMLLRDADSAMHEVKGNSGGAWLRFDPLTAPESRQRRQIEHDLRGAVDRAEIGVAYQPVVELDGCDVVALEATARWEHPRLGVVPPSAFLPLAEDFGLLERITEQLLQAGVAEIADRADIILTVAVTERFLAGEDLPARVRDLLARHGLPGHRLRLDVAETALAAAGGTASDALRELARMGVGLAIDDFGTGHGSLEALRAAQVSALKLDRSFVAHLGRKGSDRAVEATVALARAVGAAVIAKGVETEGQQRALTKLGVSHGQGWMFGPVPATSAPGSR